MINDHSFESLLKSKESKNSIDENINLNINLPHTNKHLPISELETVVDISKVFVSERNLSNCYRFLGNINIIASNVLFNWSGDTSYQNVLELMDFDNESQEYVNTQEDVLKESDGWFYYQTGTTQCEKIFLEPNQERFSIYDLSGQTNWNMWLTYPAKANVKDLVFSGVPLSNGLAVFSADTITIDNRAMTAFICPIAHGLGVGDDLVLTGATTGYEGIFKVYALGLQDGLNSANVFVLDIDNGVPPLLSGSGLYFYRLYEDTRSIYVSRWYKRMSELADFEYYNNAFATNIFNDQLWAYNFNKSYDIGQLFDYLGRPLTEIYITLIKKQDEYYDNSQVWTRVMSGVEGYVKYENYDINIMHTSSPMPVIPIEENVNNSSEYIFGDIVEYNPKSQTEKVLVVAQHRFNTLNRESNNFWEGYYYQPHHKMQIRQFSDYIGLDFEGSPDAPFYAYNLGNGLVAWRDVINNDTANRSRIPFLNGCHYIYNLIDLYVRRQDPCKLYDIGNRNFVEGICDMMEDYSQVNINEICK